MTPVGDGEVAELGDLLELGDLELNQRPAGSSGAVTCSRGFAEVELWRSTERPDQNAQILG